MFNIYVLSQFCSFKYGQYKHIIIQTHDKRIHYLFECCTYNEKNNVKLWTINTWTN